MWNNTASHEKEDSNQRFEVLKRNIDRLGVDSQPRYTQQYYRNEYSVMDAGGSSDEENHTQLFYARDSLGEWWFWDFGWEVGLGLVISGLDEHVDGEDDETPLMEVSSVFVL